MARLLIILGSPHRGGVSESLSRHFASGFATAGGESEFCHLADHVILPCEGCNACFNPPHHCVLACEDDTAKIFSRMQMADILLFASPIYFYALPARFKALIDRGQLFYAKRKKVKNQGALLPPGLAILCAARKKGDKLFEGAERTLSWFLQAAGSNLINSHVFRGLEKVSDIDKNMDDQLWRQGFALGEKCMRQTSFPT